VSRNRRFEDKRLDGVGLNLNPPEHDLVRSCDERSQIQAERNAPSIAHDACRAGTVTHDYKRHGVAVKEREESAFAQEREHAFLVRRRDEQRREPAVE
jgi:hypothetical protein